MTNRSNDFENPIDIANGGTGAMTAAQAIINLGIELGSRTILGTTDQIVVSNGSGILGNPVISLFNAVIFPGVGQITVPTGNTSQRDPSPVLGMIRANSDTNTVETYSNGEWTPVNSVSTNTIFVSKSGNDLNSGTSLLLPKLTIQAAIDIVPTGGLVIVTDSGQYSENLTITQGMQIWAPTAELDGTGSGDLITVSGGGTTVVRLMIGDINQGGPGLAVNIPDPGTVLFLDSPIFLGNIDCHGSLLFNDVATITSNIHIFSTGVFSIETINALGCTFTFDPGSTIVGDIQVVTGPGNTNNTVYGGQTFNDLISSSGGFITVSKNTTVDQADLTGAGQVNLVTFGSTTASYQINEIQLNGFGTNFSGGGDRNLDITDGTSVWTTIPAAILQSLANARWGSGAVPYPISIPLNQASVPGTNIYGTYSGGTIDYTAGSVAITLVYERVTN